MAPSTIRFWLNDRRIDEGAVSASTSLLRYLRDHLGLMGTKEGCGEGDCGACTVALIEPRPGGGGTFRGVNACLLLLGMCHGKRIYTVEALRARPQGMGEPSEGLHPVQRALVQRRGSQCGFCTPGFAMSMFEACYRDDADDSWQADAQLAGNLCRCTGYRPLREALADVIGLRPEDRFAAELKHYVPETQGLSAYRGLPGQEGPTYISPTSLAEVWAARAEHPEARLVAGGTDLALDMAKRGLQVQTLIGLDGVDELRALEASAQGWTVGAGVTLTRLRDELGGALPALDKMLRRFGSRQIRNRATVGGSLCNASPIGDLAPLLLALDATAVVAGPAGQREVPMRDFFVAYRKTALREDELLLAVRLPRLGASERFGSYKVSKRRELDISIVSAAFWVQVEGGKIAQARLAYGGVAATPKRAVSAEAAMVGRSVDDADLSGVFEALDAELRPISDHRGSSEYRERLVRNLLRGFLLEAASGPPAVPARATGTLHLGGDA